jgi:tRNA A-37 threonylcarbamoyl transferase component Bud32
MSVLDEIQSRFDVIAKLGEGGMGCVYKVRHRDLDEMRIVKTLGSQLSDTSELRTRFVNEARRGMKLRHANIAAVYDFSVCADGTGYILMEFVDGCDLKDVLASKGPMPARFVVDVAMQALEALSYLHGQNVVHRDISPDNLMLTHDQQGRMVVKLIDLGIAKSLDAQQTMTVQGQFIGKVTYASPEQFGGRDGKAKIDARSDLYSLGVVLYELLTNAQPFDGEDTTAIIAAHLFRAPERFERTAAGQSVPAVLREVIYRALEKSPEKRFQSASAFQAALTAAVPFLPQQGPAGASGNTGKPQLRKLAPMLLVRLLPAAGVLVAVAAGATMFYRHGETRAGTEPVMVTADRASLTPVVARRSPYGKYYAIVVGEGRYSKLPPLVTAENDAGELSEVLRTKYGFEVNLLLNASRYEILSAIANSRKRVGPADNLVIFYAGHGTFDRVNESGYWQPVDADPGDTSNWISAIEIAEALYDVPAKRTLVIADSCYAGAIGLIRGGPQQNGRDGAENVMSRRSRLALTSGGLQPVLDSADGHHSVFTRALLEALKNDQEAEIDIHAIHAALAKRVRSAAAGVGAEQDPQLAAISRAGDEGGSFRLASVAGKTN